MVMRMTQSRDEIMHDLMVRARSGDREAVEQVIIRMRPLLWRMSTRWYIRGLERVDIVSAGIEAILIAIPSWTRDKKVVPWLLGLVKRHYITMLQAERSRMRSNEAGEDLSLDDVDSPIDPPDPRADPTTGFDCDPIWDLLSELTSAKLRRGVTHVDMAEVLRLMTEGWNWFEISVMMGVDRKCIDNRVTSIRRLVRDMGIRPEDVDDLPRISRPDAHEPRVDADDLQDVSVQEQ